MSRLGAKPVAIPKGVTVRVEGPEVRVKGPKGELSIALPACIAAEAQADSVLLSRKDDSKTGKSLHGMSRRLVLNMVEGVTNGYLKVLELEGVGFKAEVKGGKLVMALGFSSPVEYEIPGDIKVAVSGSAISVSGPDKGLVGDVSARIRSFYPPEPYKGKGIRYRGEHIRRKAGKTVA